MREHHTKSTIAQSVYFSGFAQKTQNKAGCRLNLIFNLNSVGYIYNTTQNLNKLLKNSVFFSTHCAQYTQNKGGRRPIFIFKLNSVCNIYNPSQCFLPFPLKILKNKNLLQGFFLFQHSIPVQQFVPHFLSRFLMRTIFFWVYCSPSPLCS